jgi:hypothetical protein
MYNKKFQRVIAGVVAGILIVAMLVTGIMSSMSI